MSVYKKWFRGPVRFAPSADEEHRRNVFEEMERRKEHWQYAPVVFADLRESLVERFPRAKLEKSGDVHFRLSQSGSTLIQVVLSTRETQLQLGQVIELWLSVIDYDKAPEEVSVRDIHEVVNETLVYASPES